MANRKDSKGRVLRTGESQRKDGIYMYRYTDFNKKRLTVYASTLKELREKENEIRKSIDQNINYIAGEITVLQLVKRYTELKQGISDRSKMRHNVTINALSKDIFSNMQIKNVKKSDVQQWAIRLYNQGKKFSTIKTFLATIKAAFNMAYDEEIINRNPCNFRLSGVIENNSERRKAITSDQEEALLDFFKYDNVYKKYYDIIVILLETGIRVSELCGLTLKDVDLKNRKLKIDHQLQIGLNNRLEITAPKSQSGIREIPLTDKACQSFKKVIEKRNPKIEKMIQGYTGFIFLNSWDSPVIHLYVERILNQAVKKYNKENPDYPLPRITPHMLRHTFCSKLANKGMTVKNLQYIMGHSSAKVTLDVYTHTSYDMAEQQMREIL